MQKAISPIIGAVILVAIIMAIGVLLSSSFTSIFKEQSTTAYDKGSCVGSSLDIMSVKCEQSAPDYSDPDLVGYWSLDSVNATNYTLDLTAQNNDGQLVTAGSSVTPIGGKIENGLLFDGVNDYVNAGSGESLNLIGNFTFSWWDKRTIDENRGIISKRVATEKQGDWHIFTGTGGDDVRLGIWNASADADYCLWYAVLSDFTIFHYYVLTFNGSVYELYVDGISSGVRTNDYSIVSNSDTVKIGYDGQSTFFNGTIDEVRIYNRSLSADEILQHYNHHKLKLGIFNTGQIQLNNITILSRIGTNIYTNVTSISLASGEGKIIETNTSRGELSQLRVSAKNCPIFIEKNNETIDIVNCN